MATIKSFTDLEQSKKLAEILPLESADMYFTGEQSIINPKEWEYNDTPRIRGKYIGFDDKRIFYPCWSLAALLNLLDYPSLTQNKENEWEVCVLNCESDGYIEISAGNPVDACYKMVLKLHEKL